MLISGSIGQEVLDGVSGLLLWSVDSPGIALDNSVIPWSKPGESVESKKNILIHRAGDQEEPSVERNAVSRGVSAG